MKYLLLLGILILSIKNINAQTKPEVTILEYFPGGNDSLIRFVNKKFRAPSLPDSINLSGCFSVSFKISVEGYAKDFIVTKKIGYGFEEELIRVLKLMPKWDPKKEDGIVVESDYFPVPMCVRASEQ